MADIQSNSLEVSQKSKYLFMLEDSIFKQHGLYLRWSCLYITNLVILFSDDTKGASRNFNIAANGLSVIYCGMASANVIYGNQLPSSVLLIAGPVHQYLFWLLFAYFGGPKVLGDHPIGVINWFSLFLVGMFTLDMIFKTWILAIYPNIYLNYVKSKSNVSENSATLPRRSLTQP